MTEDVAVRLGGRETLPLERPAVERRPVRHAGLLAGAVIVGGWVVVAVLAPVLAMLLVLGVYPKLATSAIDPASEAIVSRVAPAGRLTDVGEPSLDGGGLAVVEAGG